MMLMGLLLIAAAFFLSVYTLWGEYRAKVQSKAALSQVTEYIHIRTEMEEDGRNTEMAVVETAIDEESAVVPVEVPVPDFLYNPEMEMPEKTINGQNYIGVVEIPELELTLPIISEWSDEKLKISPCRYVGSAYTNDLILSGHSYVNHFRYIRKLERGAEIIFTDMDGTRFVYEVNDAEVIDASGVEQMLGGEWDMSLFTCTTSGSARHTVRCRLVPEKNPWMMHITDVDTFLNGKQ